MEAIIKSIKKKKIPINQTVVISNKRDAKGLKVAKKLGIQTEIVESKDFKGTRWEYDQKIIEVLKKYGVTKKKGIVCLAGFMRILSPEFVKRYKNRMLNIHPAILPAFPGLDAQKKAINHGVKFSGCTVHFVDEGIDSGPIILQAIVTIKDTDTEDILSKRILIQEHKIYPKAVELLAKGKIKILDKKTIIS